MVRGGGRRPTELPGAGGGRVLPVGIRVAPVEDEPSYSNQFSLVAPILAHRGMQLRMPETGGQLDPRISTVDELMNLLGVLSRREIAL